MSYISNKRYKPTLLCTVVSKQMVSIIRRAVWFNFTNLIVSFYLRGMCNTMTNNTSSEFSTSLIVTWRDLASQNLSHVLFYTNILNQTIALTQHLLASLTLELYVRSARTLWAALLCAFYYLNRLKHTSYLLFQNQKLTLSLSASFQLRKQASRYRVT